MGGASSSYGDTLTPPARQCCRRLATPVSAAKRIGATKADLARLEAALAANPRAGDAVPGLRGLRKVRFALGDRGKRGGGRAIYALVLDGGVTALLRAYAKSEQADLTPEEKRGLASLLKEVTDG